MRSIRQLCSLIGLIAEGQTEGFSPKCAVYVKQVDIMEITLLNIKKPKEKKNYSGTTLKTSGSN